MQTINIKKLDDMTFEVVVEADTQTTHVVTVDPAYARRIVGDAETETFIACFL